MNETHKTLIQITPTGRGASRYSTRVRILVIILLPTNPQPEFAPSFNKVSFHPCTYEYTARDSNTSHVHTKPYVDGRRGDE
jgi:hypothetical protein